MGTVAMWIGYAVMLAAGLAATAFAWWWVIEFSIKKAGLTGDVIAWARDRALKRRSKEAA